MKKIYLLTSLLAVSFLLQGMSKPVDEEMQPTTENQKAEERKSHYTKPHAGISLDYQKPKNLQIGDNLELELHFKVRAQAEQLQLKVRTGDVLLLQSDSQYAFDTSVNKKNSVIIRGTALKDGAARINLSATIIVDGKYQSRSFSIPVTVGDAAQFKSGVTGVVISRPGYTVDKEQGVVSMPAVETSE